MTTGPHDHPFYRPLWRRLAIVATTAIWTSFEIYNKAQPLWIMLAIGFFLYSVWFFLLTYPNPPKPPQE